MMYDFSPKLLDVKTGDYRRNIAQDSRISRYGIEIPIHHHHTVTALPSTSYQVPGARYRDLLYAGTSAYR